MQRPTDDAMSAMKWSISADYQPCTQRVPELELLFMAEKAREFVLLGYSTCSTAGQKPTQSSGGEFDSNQPMPTVSRPNPMHGECSYLTAY